MKEVTIKISTRVCCRELGGCGRTIIPGEKAWQQRRTGTKIKKRGKTVRYLCKQCYGLVAR
jgi:hypothetical protein